MKKLPDVQSIDKFTNIIIFVVQATSPSIGAGYVRLITLSMSVMSNYE